MLLFPSGQQSEDEVEFDFLMPAQCGSLKKTSQYFVCRRHKQIFNSLQEVPDCCLGRPKRAAFVCFAERIYLSPCAAAADQTELLANGGSPENRLANHQRYIRWVGVPIGNYSVFVQCPKCANFVHSVVRAEALKQSWLENVFFLLADWSTNSAPFLGKQVNFVHYCPACNHVLAKILQRSAAKTRTED